MTTVSRRPPRRQPAKSGDELVALVGGPFDRRWYTPGDWQLQVELAGWARETHGHPPGHASLLALTYVETTEWQEHPKPPEWPAGGRVWRQPRRPVDE
jgi:hypothetical protein